MDRSSEPDPALFREAASAVARRAVRGLSWKSVPEPARHSLLDAASRFPPAELAEARALASALSAHKQLVTSDSASAVAVIEQEFKARGIDAGPAWSKIRSDPATLIAFLSLLVAVLQTLIALSQPAPPSAADIDRVVTEAIARAQEEKRSAPPAPPPPKGRPQSETQRDLSRPGHRRNPTKP